jgi:hypothetical protein
MARPPPWFLLQTSDLQLRQVSRTLVGDTLCSSWWRTQFGPDSPFTIAPLRTHLELPVYGIDLPLNVLEAMLHVIQVPDSLADVWRHLPTPLKDHMTLTTWRGYLRAYGFVETDDITNNDLPAAKVMRSEPKNPYQKTIKSVAIALYQTIMTGHPDAETFRLGGSSTLVCHFVAREKTTRMGPNTFTIPHPVLEKQLLIVGHFINNLEETEWDIFSAAFLSSAPPNTAVFRDVFHKADPKSRATSGIISNKWPLSPDANQRVELTKQDYSVFALQLQY